MDATCLLATVQRFQQRWTLSTEQLTLGQSHHWGVAANKESDLVARDGRRWGPANGSARVSPSLSVILGNVICSHATRGQGEVQSLTYVTEGACQ